MSNLSQKELNEELVDACKEGYDVEIVKLLIDKGAEVNVKNSWDESPLHYASAYGYLEIVKYLVEAGADVNHLNFWCNKTPLYYASNRGRQEVVTYLESKGGLL